MALHPDHLRRSRVDARDAEPRLFVADETARRPEFDLVAIEFAGTRIDGGIDADQHAIWCKILARRGFDPEAAKIHVHPLFKPSARVRHPAHAQCRSEEHTSELQSLMRI